MRGRARRTGTAPEARGGRCAPWPANLARGRHPGTSSIPDRQGEQDTLHRGGPQPGRGVPPGGGGPELHRRCPDAGTAQVERQPERGPPRGVTRRAAAPAHHAGLAAHRGRPGVLRGGLAGAVHAGAGPRDAVAARRPSPGPGADHRAGGPRRPGACPARRTLRPPHARHHAGVRSDQQAGEPGGRGSGPGGAGWRAAGQLAHLAAGERARGMALRQPRLSGCPGDADLGGAARRARLRPLPAQGGAAPSGT